MSPVTSFARVLVPLAVLLASSAAAHAQAVPTEACKSGTPGRLGARLSDTVLDRISGMSASPFAHAFVLAYVADSGRQDHWLVQCIQAFRATAPARLQELAALRIDIETLLKELRRENAAAREEERLRTASGTTLKAVLEKAVADMSIGTVGVLAPELTTVHSNHCRGTNPPTNICGPLDRLRDTTLALLTLVQRAGEAEAQLASINTQSGQVAKQLEETAAAIVADSSLLLQARKKDSASQVLQAVDTVILNQTIEDREAARNAAVDSLGKLKTAAEDLGRVIATAQKDQNEALPGVKAAADALLQALSRSGSRISTTIAVLAPSDASLIAAELPAGASIANLAAVPRPPAPSVALAVADFVVDRAKQELVFAFIATMYSRMYRDALLQVAFPETFRLMRSLAPPRDSTLPVPTAATVPVNVWRATASSDFLAMADHLVAADPGIVCRSSTACMQRVVHLRPFAAASTRILTGDPVLDVVRDLPHAMRTEWTSQTRGAAMNGILRGAHIISGLADAYYAQGAANGADPARHPYILNPRALSHVGKSQRDLFVRLLLARAAAAAGPAAAELNEEELTAALLAVTRVIDQMQAGAEQDREPDIRLLIQQAFRTMGEAAAIGRLVAADSASGVTLIHDRWKAFGNVVDPIISRNYGLVLARSAQLYVQLTDSAPPRTMLTFASLAASLAEAKDGAQMRAAFEAAASPVGGWQAKRYHQGPRTTITALPGVIGGGEKLIGGGWGGSAGVAMPIGFDVQLTERLSGSDKTKGCTLGLCSAGLFIPVVDLGALATYRFDSDPLVESEPRTSLRQVFAPGLYFSFGIGRSPAALLVGAQLMPSLRSVDPSRQGDTDGHAIRLGAGLAVDVVLLNVSGN